MYTKTQAAFILSCRKLAIENGKLYFWTFTFTKCMPDWWYPRSWNLFMARLQNLFGGMVRGIRVVEVHPGGHGLHYHAVINRRLAIQIAVRMGRRVGIGRMQPKICTPGWELYLAKYLAKRSELWPGMRRWGAIGGFRPVTVRRIEVSSDFHRNMLFIHCRRQVQWHEARRVWLLTRMYGPVHLWPKQVVNSEPGDGGIIKVPSGEKNVLDTVEESGIIYRLNHNLKFLREGEGCVE